MAQLQPLPVSCPVCGEGLRIRLHTKPTSEKAPNGPTAVVFIEADNSELEKHLGAHLADIEELAA